MQNRLIEKCVCLIVVSSNPKLEKLGGIKSANEIGQFSIVPPDADAIWNNIVSAIEIPLIEFLNEKMMKPDIPKYIMDDMEAVMRRIERYSDFPKNQSKQKSSEIPDEIRKILQRYLSQSSFVSIRCLRSYELLSDWLQFVFFCFQTSLIFHQHNWKSNHFQSHHLKYRCLNAVIWLRYYRRDGV